MHLLNCSRIFLQKYYLVNTGQDWRSVNFAYRERQYRQKFPILVSKQIESDAMQCLIDASFLFSVLLLTQTLMRDKEWGRSTRNYLEDPSGRFSFAFLAQSLSPSSAKYDTLISLIEMQCWFVLTLRQNCMITTVRGSVIQSTTLPCLNL